MSKKIALISLAVILCIVNLSIIKKEKHLNSDKFVYLALAPVDPRSLMQGDYMALRLELSDKVYNAILEKEAGRSVPEKTALNDGHVIVSLNDLNIGTFKTLYQDQSLSDNEILIHYRMHKKTIELATNAFFFQEGHGELYQDAYYGRFSVDKHGSLLLTGMYDKNLTKLGTGKKE